MTGMVSVETSHTHTRRVNSPDMGQYGLLRFTNVQIEETFLDTTKRIYTIHHCLESKEISGFFFSIKNKKNNNFQLHSILGFGHSRLEK